MKKILLGAFLFVASQGIAQTTKPIDSFLGIKFGTPYNQVAAALKGKGVVDTESDKHDFIGYKDLQFNNRKAAYTAVSFYKDKVYSSMFVFAAQKNVPLTEQFNSISQDLSKDYGPADKTVKEFKDPYEEGDGEETEALETGNAEFSSYWLHGSGAISVTAHKGEIIVIIRDYDVSQIVRAEKGK